MSLSPIKPTRYIDILAALWCLLIIVGSLAPAPELPAAPGSDKLLHLLGYALLGLLSTWNRDGTIRILGVTTAIILLGGMIELVQPFVNRYAELGDFAANSAGAVIGLATTAIIKRLRRLK
ncbi:MAG: hypothetical protein O3A84_09200 [Proteobacteria bacterium]|nr:hypothetical protein [Pseudomonadota bacterium]